jgi:hypothetical protein
VSCRSLPARTASAAIAVATAATAAISTAGTSATAARTTTAARSAVSALCAWTGFVHGNGASAQISSIERLDRSIRLSAIGHLYETKSPQPSAELIADEIHLTHCSILSKSLF